MSAGTSVPPTLPAPFFNFKEKIEAIVEAKVESIACMARVTNTGWHTEE